MFFDAFNNVLCSWVTIIALSDESECFPEELCKSASVQIFNTFLKCHLTLPNGPKTSSDDEFDENEDDRVANKEQLQYIGIFGRLVSTK